MNLDKFRELPPILTARGGSLKIKGKIYRACDRRIIVYGSETWSMKIGDMLRLDRATNLKVVWMCGVTLRKSIALNELRNCLNIESVKDAVRRGRLMVWRTLDILRGDLLMAG